MGGVLTHIVIGLILGSVIYSYYFLYKKREFLKERRELSLVLEEKSGLMRFWHVIKTHRVVLYSLSIFAGQIIVDFFKFFFAGICQGRWDFLKANQDEVFWFWADITSSFVNWFAFGFVIFVIISFLYVHHVINKKTMFEYDEIVILFVLGVIIHLIVDLFVFERIWWL